MSFIYYKMSKKEKITILEIFPEGRCSQSDFRTPCKNLAHPAKVWHTLPKFGTPCQILAYLAKLMFLPCKIDVFALRKALFSSILLLIALATPFQVCQGVLKCSKARILHVLQTLPQFWPVSMIQKATKNTKTYQKLVSNIC